MYDLAEAVSCNFYLALFCSKFNIIMNCIMNWIYTTNTVGLMVNENELTEPQKLLMRVKNYLPNSF